MIGQNKIMIIAICLTLGLSAYALRITPESIKACIDNTGWSQARCEVELMR